MDLKAFGKKVRAARKRKDMTGEVMAEKCDITPTFLRQIEAGTKGVSIDNFVNICNVLDVSPEYLLADELHTPQNTMRTRAELIEFINTLDERSFKTVLDIIKHIPLQYCIIGTFQRAIHSKETLSVYYVVSECLLQFCEVMYTLVAVRTVLDAESIQNIDFREKIMNLKEFGENVRRMRKLREMTGEKMAEKCNITPTFLRQIESGAKGVSVDNLVNICNVLNVSPAYLLSGDLNTMEDAVHTKADLIKFIDELSEEDFKSFLRVVKMLHMQL